MSRFVRCLEKIFWSQFVKEIFPTNVAKVEEVSDVGKVSSDERVDGVEWDGKEGDGEGESQLDVLAGGGRHSKELIGTPCGVLVLIWAGDISLIHTALGLLLILNSIADTAAKQVGEKLSNKYM